MKNKTIKAYAKRFHLTKGKKVLKRYAGQDHFNSRDSGKITRKKRRDVGIHKGYEKLIKSSVVK